MRHLFIINPAAKRINGKTLRIREAITAFFSEHPDIRYDVYESGWCRDSVTYVHRYVSETSETVRVHAIGGKGTLFEVVNSVVGLANAEVAAHPYGRANTFQKYFGRQNEKLFLSLKSQVFDKAIPMDVIRCGNNYGICYGVAGIEAQARVLGDSWIEMGIAADISFIMAGVFHILGSKTSQNYHVDIDGVRIEGDFVSVLVANVPCYGINMYSAVDAHPDDGVLDVYTFKETSKLKLICNIPTYAYGNYRKLPDLVSHYTAKKIKLSSDEVMCMSLDGEHFYGTSTEYEIMPKAVNFVCPAEIDLAKLPRIYGKPEEGYR
jgi:diacylglycerol kinase family enzyme